MHGMPMVGSVLTSRFSVLTRAERDAMGDDEYSPIKMKGSNLSDAGGIGYMITDALDTMLIMGLEQEYARAHSWVSHKMSFDHKGTYNTFEVRFYGLSILGSHSSVQVTIRVLGGLLSAYHLSGQDPIFLQRAVELADRILPAFDTPSGFPLTNIDLGDRQGVPDSEFPKAVSTAEISTLQLEFRYLSFLTNDDTYWHKVEQVRKFFCKYTKQSSR
jgi:endoplasmic reticulum Man9GlcNAc2 1,2-alpha-mannosidase